MSAFPAAAPHLLAHGLAVQVEDLPLPLATFYIGAAAALVLSFVLLAVGVRHPGIGRGGRALPSALSRLVCARATHVLAGTLGLLWLATVVVTALWGSREPSDNPAPNLVFVLGWIGLPVVALLLGRGALALHPGAALARLGGMRAQTGDGEAGTRLGVWPAWAGLVAFTWLELVYPTSSHLDLLGALALAWVVTGLVLASRFGIARWRDHLDPFGTYVRLLASLAPWVRRADGRLGLRFPLLGANRDVPGEPGLVALVTLLIGSVSYDGLTRTGWWQERVALATADLTSRGIGADTGRILFGSFGFVVLLVLAWGAFELAAWASARAGRLSVGRGTARAAQRFAPSLLPIALAYVVAHYTSFFVVQVQDLARLASDPLGTGADLFGTAGRTARDLHRPSGTVVWTVQVAAIVVGHVAGLLLAHDRAVELAPRAVGGDARPDLRAAVTSQLPMLALMLLYTVGGLYFLSEGLA